jgi:hypothetical protein
VPGAEVVSLGTATEIATFLETPDGGTGA